MLLYGEIHHNKLRITAASLSTSKSQNSIDYKPIHTESGLLQSSRTSDTTSSDDHVIDYNLYSLIEIFRNGSRLN